MRQELGKKEAKQNQSVLIKRDDTIVSLLNNEPETINESLAIIEKISKKHKIDFNQIAELLKNRERYISVPLGLFRSSFGPLEAVVRYLKDVMEYNFSHIAKLLNRDETTIWTTHHNSMKKSKKVIVDLELKDVDFRKLKVKKEELVIPLSVFSERKLSVLESLCLYLLENFELSYHSLGKLLDRNERTIWTAVNRARKKING